ncbi:MAG: hypothetical protein R3F43_29815 [bacterium]
MGQPGAAAFKDKAFYGVGVASNISSISLRRSTADAQARAELARVFTSRVQNLLKNYEASTGDGDKGGRRGPPAGGHQGLHRDGADGVEIVDRYYDMEQASQYALARLEPEAFEGQLDRLDRLSAWAREVIRANARKAFQELDEESAKRAAQAAE